MKVSKKTENSISNDPLFKQCQKDLITLHKAQKNFTSKEGVFFAKSSISVAKLASSPAVGIAGGITNVWPMLGIPPEVTAINSIRDLRAVGDMLIRAQDRFTKHPDQTHVTERIERFNKSQLIALAQAEPEVRDDVFVKQVDGKCVKTLPSSMTVRELKSDLAEADKKLKQAKLKALQEERRRAEEEKRKADEAARAAQAAANTKVGDPDAPSVPDGSGNPVDPDGPSAEVADDDSDQSDDLDDEDTDDLPTPSDGDSSDDSEQEEARVAAELEALRTQIAKSYVDPLKQIYGGLTALFDRDRNFNADLATLDHGRLAQLKEWYGLIVQRLPDMDRLCKMVSDAHLKELRTRYGVADLGAGTTLQ